MLTINNKTYVQHHIVLEFYQHLSINFLSTSSFISLEIVNYPNSLTNSEYTPKFEYSDDIKSTRNPEMFIPKISGHYYIKIVERDVAGNYAHYEVYLKIIDVAMKTSIPMHNEKSEFDSEKGWSKTIERNLQALSKNIGTKITTTVSPSEERMLGDIVFLSDIFPTDSSGYIFTCDLATEFNKSQTQLGIIVDKIDINEEDETPEKYMYNVLFSGMFTISDDDFEIDVDERHQFYFDSLNKVLTDDDSDEYVGKYFDNKKLIIIDFPIKFS